MTREEAIKMLKSKMDGTVDTSYEWAETVRMAIEALHKTEAQIEVDEWCTDCKEYDHERHCCPRWNKVIRETLKDMQMEKRTKERIETHACDCISRQWLMECVNEGWIKFDTEKDENRFIHLVRDIAPSVEPEIIRCKDCKWNQGAVCINFAEVRVFSDDFCSHAERREE